MELQNGYVVMYNAPERITAEKQGPIYASKGIPAATDAMLISYDNGATYVDCKQFKLIYSDGTHLLGSISGLPAEDDVNIVIKAGDEIVFGEVIESKVVKAEDAE